MYRYRFRLIDLGPSKAALGKRRPRLFDVHILERNEDMTPLDMLTAGTVCGIDDLLVL